MMAADLMTPASSSLQAFLDRCRGAFRRRDQVRWAALYVEGLLRPGGRKTVEHIVRTAAADPGPAAGNAAQALQHFLNQSPWDEDVLLGDVQELLAPCRSAEDLLVVAELAFPKQGRHSVGVQRQYSSALGRKTNCQVAVALLHVGVPAAGAPASPCFPLALRLYLPRGWQQDPERLAAAGVPAPFRRPRTRTDLARELLENCGLPLPERRLTSLAGCAVGDELEAAAKDRGLSYLPEAAADAADAVQACIAHLQDLGLDHFEGRSWRGFHHHAALVLFAHAYRVLHPNEPGCA
jgi:SRSO17 transposase